MDTLPKDLDFTFKVSLADFEARCWVQGVQRDRVRGIDRLSPIAGSFHERFCSHPWVRESQREGWHRDLSAYLVRNVKMRMLRGEKLSCMPSIAALMPDASDVANWRVQSRKARKAAEWRERVTATHGSVDAYLSRTSGNRGTAFRTLSRLNSQFVEVAPDFCVSSEIVKVKP